MTLTPWQTAGKPPVNTPVTDKQGHASVALVQYLQRLADTADQGGPMVAAAQADIAALQASGATTTSNLTAAQAAIAGLLASVAAIATAYHIAGDVILVVPEIADRGDGWLPCDGSPVSRTAYPDLFAAIGTAYGGGDGSTTFTLPGIAAAPWGGKYWIRSVT